MGREGCTAPGLVVNLRSVEERFCRHCAMFGCSWLTLGLYWATWACNFNASHLFAEHVLTGSSNVGRFVRTQESSVST